MSESVENNKIIEAPKGIKWYHPAFLIATWFGVGKIPFAPGTFGSLFTFPLFILSHYLLVFVDSEESFRNIYFVCLALLFFIGQWATHVYCKRTGKEDPKEVVIDEVVGQMLVFLGGFLSIANALNLFTIIYGTEAKPMPDYTFATLTSFFTSSPDFAPYMLAVSAMSLVCFILFRIFDIWKPWPINWCDKNIKNSFGVMLDDVFAALYATIALYAIILLLLKLISN